MSKKILIGENSKLVKTILQNLLQNEGYEVYIAENGFDVFLKIKEIKPDLVLCSTVLNVLSGFEVSKIVKGRETLNLPVIIYSITEENFSDKILSACLCDDFVCIDLDKPEVLLDPVARLVQAYDGYELELKEDRNNSPVISAVSEITGFYQRESDYLNIIGSIFRVFEGSETPRGAGLSVLDSIFDYVPYDIILLSVKNENYVFDICRVKENLNDEEIKDFMMVSHNYFLDNCSENEQITFGDCIFTEEGPLPPDRICGSEKIKAIEYSVLYGDSFVGTVTVGSTKTDVYHESVSKKFQYFSEKLTPFVSNIINGYKMGNTIRNLRKAFSSFVPEEIIDELIQNADDLTETTGEKRRIAILVCDIRNFTNISEGNKPEDVVGFLNSYFTEMVGIIQSHGGSIDKFMGDAIMALFGAPISYEDNAQRAVEAAIEMVQKLPDIDFSRLTLPEGYDKISIGIGIHYGEVILGSIGCSAKKDYTVIGDCANLASRLEGITKMYGKHIIISDAVKNELNENIKIRHLDKVAVKGKKIPVNIFSVETNEKEFDEEIIRNYAKGMELYEVGAWALAKGYFDKVLQIDSQDKAASIMLNRCQEYMENPPDNWNGAVILTSK